MMVAKNTGKTVCAYELGTNTKVEEELIEEGKIVVCDDGSYELFSSETVGAEHGEKAVAGDYFKVDKGNNPYPNAREWFLANHKPISGDEYEQIPKPLEAWTADQPIDDRIQFLIDHKGLILNPDEPEKYFTAPLWGTIETADNQATLIFYSVTRDDSGKVVDADFNFVMKEAFNDSETGYHVVE